MNPVSRDIALKFCELCNWTYEVWVTHKRLFDKNKIPESNIGKCVAFTNRLSVITQEYSLQQIAKLHDPARQGKLSKPHDRLHGAIRRVGRAKGRYRKDSRQTSELVETPQACP